MQIQNTKKDTSYLMLAVFILLAVRLFVSWFLPLTDMTEARYGEIARLMVEMNDWIVLHVDYNFAFWAKPPMSTWLSAASMRLFGINEFALRLPSFLLSVGIVLIVSKALSFDKRKFWFFMLAVFLTPEFIIHAGIVSTDTALSFSIVLTMISFWKAMNESRQTIWAYLFFVGISIGLLAKGPLTLVLIVPPLLLWCLTQKTCSLLWKRLPWLVGILLCLLISLPWYFLVESHSPGFLNYFIVGEHFKRFLEPGWKGDLYGNGHDHPYGTIWLYMLLFIPQISYVAFRAIKERSSIFKDSWLSFLVFWVLWIPCFFTFASNILHTYTLPCVVPCVLLLMHWAYKPTSQLKFAKIGLGIGSFLVLLSLIFLYNFPKLGNNINSDKLIIRKNIDIENTNVRIAYWKNRTYSGQFYTNGKAKQVNTVSELDSFLGGNHDSYLFVKPNDIKDLTSDSSRLKLIDTNNKYNLYRVR